jgi:lycopene cyclase domain-containing protein
MKHWLYLAFLLIWIGVIGLQWLIGWRKLWKERWAWLWVAIGLSVYFSFAGAIAIEQHIWFLRPDFLIGWYIGNMPVEEMLFYLLTTVMIVQGFVMLFPRPTSS